MPQRMFWSHLISNSIYKETVETCNSSSKKRISIGILDFCKL
uniref:Uncharacterized protein n=1 Tax=Anguilla anguilla TaxID=7936 RepID=A0A0E9VV26_ANGAN